jgi:MerR family transcriptional regulator, mercuric resistance operon regulatory protein
MDLTIGNLARQGGVGVETIRYYQRRGLLPTPRRGNGVRRYDEGDLKRLRFIRAAQAAGFTLEQVGELLALDATHDRARARALAKARIVDLDAKIAELEAARDALKRLARDCSANSRGPCPIITAFEQNCSHTVTRP